MKNKMIYVLMLLAMLSGCSNNDVKNEEDASYDVEVSDSSDSDIDDDLDFVTDEKSVEEVAAADESVTSEEPAAIVNEAVEETVAQSSSEVLENDSLMSATLDYVAQENDTLMFVAFKIYGDYDKWKELKALNPDLKLSKIKKGDVIKYKEPTEKFVWAPKGNPYLIKQGDTLGLISLDVYKKEQRWKEIWDNNREMIKNPNLIFAGFVLHYIPDVADRVLASKTEVDEKKTDESQSEEESLFE